MIEKNLFDGMPCPRCRYDTGLHHGRVTLYDRPEDSDITTVTFMVPDEGRTRSGGDSYPSDDIPGSRNPSKRRGGIVISFSCETCGDDLELTIAQHKGQTIVGWRYPDHLAPDTTSPWQVAR